ncbi:MAG: AMP-binding protein, partial [Deltaproteobacteria bacterium]|nr:AMP-binding protein [Deltaproteobacteria bacterium]
MDPSQTTYADLMSFGSESTLPRILARQAEKMGRSEIAIREKAYGIWQTYTWQDYFDYVKKVGLGLKALGLKRGENIGLITNNHPEWLYSELGGQAVGSVTVNLFTSAVAEELSFSLNRIQAAYVIVQDQEQTDKLIETRDKLSHLRKVIYIDPTGMMRNYQKDDWLLSFSQLLELGDELDRKEPGLFEKELALGRHDDCAVMIQTSGTTGMPKLAMLSHRNFAEMAAQWIEAIHIRVAENWISMSPPAWIVDQMWGIGVSLLGGMTMNFPETPETITEDFREIGPSTIITASRFWEELASKIRVKMSDSGWIKRKLFSFAENVGRRVVDRQTNKRSIPFFMKCAHWLSRILIYRPLLDRVGCINFRSAYTGGHPISPDVIRFFRAIGL